MKEVHPQVERLSQPLHLRAVERSGIGPEGGQLHRGCGLPQTHDQPRREQPAQHRTHEASLPAALALQRP